MVNIKSFISEFIQVGDIDQNQKAKIRIEPYFDEDAQFESLIAEVDYCGEKRKININKGNAKRLAAVWGDDTKNWIQKEINILLPSTDEEIKSKSKFILKPVVPANPIEDKKAQLRARGVSESTISELESLGEI